MTMSEQTRRDLDTSTPTVDDAALYWQWGGREWRAPERFDRMIAKVKADALREAAREILPPYNCELNFEGTEDKRTAIYVEAVGEVHAQLEDIAKRVEGEA